MSMTAALRAQIPLDLKQTLDDLCHRFGLRRNSLIEQALREKIEDLLDSSDIEAKALPTIGERVGRG